MVPWLRSLLLHQDGGEPPHGRIPHHSGAGGSSSDHEHLGGDAAHPPKLTQPKPVGRVANGSTQLSPPSPPMADAMIRLEGVTKRYKEAANPAVDSLSMEIPRGEVVILVGPSGCGKTTILKMINRLIEPSTGVIEVDGRDVRPVEPHVLRRGIGYVIQQIGLFPHRTIADNIAAVPKLLGWDKARIDERVAELIELVGLDPEMAFATRPHSPAGSSSVPVSPGRWPPTHRSC